MDKRPVTARAMLIAAVLTLPQAAQAQPEPYLARFAGTWIGQGSLKLERENAREAVYCRITSQLSPDGTTLQQNGRCAAGERSRTIAGTLVYDSARNSVSGNWSGGPERADVSGRRQGDRLVLQLRGSASDARGNATVTLDPSANGRYRMTVSGGEGAGEIDFRRQ
jgi:hypothetical protein